MNPQKTAILIDSGCDLPAHIREEYDIEMIPLRVIYPEKDYRDGVDIDPLMVYRRFPDEFPSTSTPSLAEVIDKFDELREKGYENVIALSISHQLSGTFNTLRLAASEYRGLNIFVFDTLNISCGSGIYAIWASYLRRLGKNFQEICEALKKKLGQANVFFYMDTLHYLQRGGRIGRVTSIVGSALQLKPIITCDTDGVYKTVAKIRGAKMGKMRLSEEIMKFGAGSDPWIIVEEGGAHEEAMALREMLENHPRFGKAKILFDLQITASLAINTGPGLIGATVLRSPEVV